MFQLTPLPRTLEAALRDASDGKVAVRLSALADLVRFADGPFRARAVAALEHTLRHDAAEAVRAEAALALADARAVESMDALLHATEDLGRRVRQMAIMALGEVADGGDARVLAAVTVALEDEAPALRYQALIAYFRLQQEGIKQAMIAADDPDGEVRHVAFRLIEERCFSTSGEPESGGALPQDIVELCRRALEDSSFSVRLVAAVVLLRGGDSSGRDVIVRAIEKSGRDVDAEDLQSAIELAGKHGLAEARSALSRRAFGGLVPARDPYAWHSRVALARLGDTRARESILKGLGAFSRDTRTLAVAAAGQAGLVEARDRIERMRGDARSAEPDAVAEALRLLGREASDARL